VSLLPALTTRLPGVAAASPVVAMTFDDGPHETLTPVLLDMLRLRGVRATFYLVGPRVARHPALVRRMVAEGHEVGNHTWTHPDMTTLWDGALLREVDRTAAAIHAACGVMPATLRPPYGAIGIRQARMIHAERSLPSVLWSVDPQDWRRPGAEVVAQRIVAAAHPGAVILAHDIHAATVAAMPAALDALVTAGYRFATMSTPQGRAAQVAPTRAEPDFPPDAR